MELSDFTMQVLKNFAAINPNIVINPGSNIMTMAESKTIMSSVDVGESFEKTVGIYDLNEFLSVLGLVNQPRVRFDDNNMLVSDVSGRAEIKYFYSDPNNLTSPKKSITMPSVDVSFTLDHNTLNNLKRAAAAMNHSELSITGRDNLITLSVLDKDNSTSNTYSIDVEGTTSTNDFNFIITIGNLKLLPADYKVDISSQLISQFTSINLEKPVTYWVALEKSSTYN